MANGTRNMTEALCCECGGSLLVRKASARTQYHFEPLQVFETACDECAAVTRHAYVMPAGGNSPDEDWGAAMFGTPRGGFDNGPTVLAELLADNLRRARVDWLTEVLTTTVPGTDGERWLSNAQIAHLYREAVQMTSGVAAQTDETDEDDD